MRYNDRFRRHNYGKGQRNTNPYDFATESTEPSLLQRDGSSYLLLRDSTSRILLRT